MISCSWLPSHGPELNPEERLKTQCRPEVRAGLKGAVVCEMLNVHQVLPAEVSGQLQFFNDARVNMQLEADLHCRVNRAALGRLFGEFAQEWWVKSKT